jgi:hypothetical protein
VGFRVKKSFKLAPGVRMTVTPKGIGAAPVPAERSSQFIPAGE